MPDLASAVPAPHFAATMGHYLIKIWNPRKIFFEKSSGKNPPVGPKRKPLSWGSQRAKTNSKPIFFLKPDCLSTTRTYHDTYEHDWFRGQLRECRSNRPGVSGLPSPDYRTPPVCVPDVIGALAV